jgi:hypothetical protein
MTFSILLTIENVIENEQTKSTIFSMTFSNPGKIEKAIENESQHRKELLQKRTQIRGPAPRRKQVPKAVWNGQVYLTPKSSSP